MSDKSNTKACRTFSVLPACSYHGTCEEVTGNCKCDDGWTGIGDFSTDGGVHCSINIIAIKVLWILVLVSFPLLLYSSVKLFLIKFQTRKMKSFFGLVTDPSITIAICFILSSLFACILSILKIVDQETYSLASNPVATVLFYFFYSSLLIGVSSYILILVTFIISHAKVMPNTFKHAIRVQSEIVKKMAWFLMVLVPIFGCPPLINITYPHHDYQCLVGLLGAILFMSIYAVLALYRYLGIIGNELEKHLQQQNKSMGSVNDPLVVFKKKVDQVRKPTIIMGSLVMAIYLVIILLDVVSVSTSYYWPIFLFSFNMSAPNMLKSLMNDSKGPSSSGTRNSKSTSKEHDVVPIQQPGTTTLEKSNLHFQKSDDQYSLQQEQMASEDEDKKAFSQVMPETDGKI